MNKNNSFDKLHEAIKDLNQPKSTVVKLYVELRSKSSKPSSKEGQIACLPEQIFSYPKAKPRLETRKPREKGKSKILSSSPEREAIKKSKIERDEKMKRKPMSDITNVKILKKNVNPKLNKKKTNKSKENLLAIKMEKIVKRGRPKKLSKLTRYSL